MGSFESGNQRSQEREYHGSNHLDWDPNVILNNLSVLEEKIHHLRELVPLINARRNQLTGERDVHALFLQQQDHINNGLTSVIVQLISAVGGLLPKQQLGRIFGDIMMSQSLGPSENVNTGVPSCTNAAAVINEHGTRSEDDPEEGDNLTLDSLEIIQIEKEELLAPSTHLCPICGKGFKRDANVRMHMRGHSDEYKTIAGPYKLPLPPSNKSSIPDKSLVRRYSCPSNDCKHNKDHKKFHPLKTILSLKNHYRRSHCDRTYTCSRCNKKKFSVLSDLKTHEKHCGQDKWLCSCGTTFTRKDKLFNHILHFKGHSPANPAEDSRRAPTMAADQGQGREAMMENAEAMEDDQTPSSMPVEGPLEDPSDSFLHLFFESNEGFNENLLDLLNDPASGMM